MVGDKSLKTQSQVSFMSVEAMEVDPAPAAVTSPVKRNHELRQLGVQHQPDPVLAPDRALSQSAGEQDWQPTRHHLSHQPGGRHGPAGPRAD